MLKARIHAGLRASTLRHRVIFVTDVDYYEMSSRISPNPARIFPGAHPPPQE
jgi:hypothetical protein